MMTITEARVRKGRICALVRTINVDDTDLLATLDSYMIPRWQWHNSGTDTGLPDYFINGTTLVRWDK